jgi:hypothetical protein
LDKIGDEYVVRLERSASVGNPLSERGFFRSITERFRAPAASKAETPESIHFAVSDILLSDLQGRSRRGTAGTMPDPSKLSLNLRVLGDHLDRKQTAGDFGISWSHDGVKLTYRDKEEIFSIENLYDIGVHMYLRRSDRNRSK